MWKSYYFWLSRCFLSVNNNRALTMCDFEANSGRWTGRNIKVIELLEKLIFHVSFVFIATAVTWLFVLFVCHKKLDRFMQFLEPSWAYGARTCCLLLWQFTQVHQSYSSSFASSLVLPHSPSLFLSLALHTACSSHSVCHESKESFSYHSITHTHTRT